MSADYWLEIDTGGDEPAWLDDDAFNVTYNLGPMLRAAGFPSWDALVGAPASETGGMLRSVADRLRADGSFDQYAPENGWGSRDWAVKFLDEFAAACAAHPKATVGAWL
jgi:hypothetical protein